MYKKIFASTLIISLFLLSSCIRLPEEKIGIDPIFIDETKIETENKIPETQSGSIKNLEKIETSTGKILDKKSEKSEKSENIDLKLNGEDEIIFENNNTETGKIISNNSKISTGESIFDKNLESNSEENLKNNTETGEIISNNTPKTSTGKNIQETSTGENL